MHTKPFNHAWLTLGTQDVLILVVVITYSKGISGPTDTIIRATKHIHSRLISEEKMCRMRGGAISTLKVIK